METSLDYASVPRVRSKTVLSLIEILLGYTGLDRIYMGCYRSGMLKMLLFLCLVLLISYTQYDSSAEVETWYIYTKGATMFLVFAIFIVDAFVVFRNGVVGDIITPFCPNNTWSGFDDIRNAKIVSFVGIILLSFALMHYMLS